MTAQLDHWVSTDHDPTSYSEAMRHPTLIAAQPASDSGGDHDVPDIDELAVAQVAEDGMRLRLRGADRDEAVRRMHGRVDIDLIAWRLYTTARTVQRVAHPTRACLRSRRPDPRLPAHPPSRGGPHAAHRSPVGSQRRDRAGPEPSARHRCHRRHYRPSPIPGRSPDMTTSLTAAPPSLDAALRAGLRWIYATEQPADAVVERRGAQITTAERSLRFVPISASGNPLIVVDLLNVHWGIGGFSPALNALPTNELPSLATQLAPMGIPACALHYHGITGTIVLDAPAHPSLIEAVRRYNRGCPRHDTQLCEAPIRDGGKSCSWHADGHRRANWPTIQHPWDRT